MQKLKAHVVARIAQAEIEADPFPHCYVRDVFPSDTYAQMLRELPEDRRFDTYPAPYEARLFLNLDPGNAKAIGGMWRRIERLVNSQDFLDAMVAKFGHLLPISAAHRASQIARTAEGESVPIGSRTMLLRDYADFALGPHTDAVNKFITAIFYLPGDDRFAAFGTSIYRPKERGFTAWRSPHFRHEKFDLLRTFSNVPNSLFVFVKTDNSFHGVEPGSYPTGGRNLMMWVPEIGTSDQTWGRLSLERSHFTG
ncbi:MAG: hypothetical protein IT548_16475 [Alphaproteobacteria bacterium]|nr:hypothetical protein [Alphaproteobacteria bacterium]